MFGNSLYGKSLFLAQKSLGVSTLRKNVLANNIANADTPHYKRKMVSFESELKRALASENPNPFRANTTHSKHMTFHESKDYRDVQSRLHLEYDTNYRNDKNNVDVEKEIADEVKNTLHYQAMTTVMSNNIRRLKSVIV